MEFHNDRGPAVNGRRGNGIDSGLFVPLADVDADVGEALLDVLRRARIAAYLDEVPVSPQDLEDVARDRLFVASSDRSDARTIVASAMRTIRPDGTAAAPALREPVDDLDTDAQFSALVAGWQIDTVAAVRAAEKDLNRTDADWRSRLEPPADAVWLEEDHYIPPPPPPLPRLAPATLGALALIALAIAVLAFGTTLGLDPNVAMLLGVGGILVGAGLLVMRLRDRPEDEDDDGAIL